MILVCSYDVDKQIKEKYVEKYGAVGEHGHFFRGGAGPQFFSRRGRDFFNLEGGQGGGA